MSFNQQKIHIFEDILQNKNKILITILTIYKREFL